MITELIFAPFMLLIDFIIGLVPNMQMAQQNVISANFYEIMQLGLFFFGSSTFVIIIVNVTAWLSIQIAWAVIEWVYKKIPGVS